MMVIWSATWLTSFSLWLMRIAEIPRSRNSVSSFRSAWLSASLSDDVGSSRISSFTSLDSALAISTSCCLPMPRSPTRVVGRSDSPTRPSSLRVRSWVSPQSITPAVAHSLPRKMFSAMESSGISASS